MSENKGNKLVVDNIEVIVRGARNKPYYEIKYREVGNDDYNVGFGSYDLNNVLKWKEEEFEVVSEKANREEIRKLLDEHYKKVDENFDISLEEKVMKEAMSHSDAATDSAFTQAISALKEADEKMDEFGKELQLDFLCGANETAINQDELFTVLGFVQASCEYSEFMFRCIYETLTERIEKIRKENEEIVRKYKRAVDNLDAVLEELSEEHE